MKGLKFTLIELLIIAAVIGILVTLLLPSLGRARESALRVKCATQLASIGKTITKSYVDNNGKLPSYDWMLSKTMESSYTCPKDDDPKELEFYFGEEAIWSASQTSYGFNLNCIGRNIMQIDNVADFVVSFDAADLAYIPTNNGGQGNGNNGHGNNMGGFDPSNPGNGRGGPQANELTEIYGDYELHGTQKWIDEVGNITPLAVDNWYYENVNFRHLMSANHLVLDGSVKVIYHRMNAANLMWP